MMARSGPGGLPLRPRGPRASGTGRALGAVTGALVAFGLLSVYSASSYVAHAEGLSDSYYLFQQASRAGVGVLALIGASLINYRIYRRLAWPILAVTIVLLVVLLLPGTESIAPRWNGARRWLTLGVTLQPSELAKIAVVIWTAALATKKQDRLHSLRYGLLPFLLVLIPVCLLVLFEPHFSAAIMIASIAAAVLFAAGARLSHFALLGLAAVPLALTQILGASYRWQRVAAFMNPDSAAATGGYQLKQSLIAVGSGGLFGVGFGKSSLKMSYLPEPQNDFIYAIIAEEWGFLGAALVIGLFLCWSILALRIARGAPDVFGRLLAVGITSIVAFGAFGHIGVALGLLPTTGVNLPFISAGGTSLVLMLGATGILLNVSRRGRA